LEEGPCPEGLAPSLPGREGVWGKEGELGAPNPGGPTGFPKPHFFPREVGPGPLGANVLGPPLGDLSLKPSN